MLPCRRFAEGNVLGETRHVRGRLHVAGEVAPLVVLHANYMFSTATKASCLEAFGMWLARPQPQVCAAFDPHRRASVSWTKGHPVISKCERLHDSHSDAAP